MFWIRIGIFLGLLVWTAAASAGEVDRSTDSQGTIHITTSKPDKTADKRAVDPAAKPDEPVQLDYKSRPLSRRPMNPDSTPGSPRKVRPSPYLNPPPPESAPGTPSPEAINKGAAR